MANALEMMAQTAIKQMLQNLPPDIADNIGQIGKTVASFKAQLDRIENQQRRIMAFLDIPAETETKELTDDRPADQ
jgi:tRNA(Leu) C34 or U34 (ribose-2'-O)-methylase TrmL